MAGRDDLLAAFSTLIARAQIGNPVQPLVLSGLRGVGKAVLLLRWRSIASEMGWATAHIEARSDADLRQQLGDAIIDILRQVSRHYRNQERVERLKRIAASFMRAAGATVSRGGLAFNVQPEPGLADTGTLETDLGELLVELGEAAREEGTGAIIMLDELQDAGVDMLAGLVGACHRINQQGLPALIVGAGLPTVGRVLSEAKSYAERLFDLRTVGPLVEGDAQDQAIAEPAGALGVAFAPDALSAFRELAGGYPFFIQTHAKFAWDAAVDSPISAADVDVASPRANEQLRRSFFSPRYDRATLPRPSAAICMRWPPSVSTRLRLLTSPECSADGSPMCPCSATASSTRASSMRRSVGWWRSPFLTWPPSSDRLPRTNSVEHGRSSSPRSVPPSS